MKVLYFLLFLILFSPHLWAFDGDFKLGVRPYYFTQLEVVGSDGWLYYKNQFDLSSWEMGDLLFNTEARLLYEKVDKLESRFLLMPTEFNLVWQGDKSSLQIGAQQFAFSETFGVNLMDIMNPRDYRFSVTDSSEFYRLAQWSINYKYLDEEFFIQAVWTPLPRMNRYPQRGASFAFYSPLATEVDDSNYYDLADGEFALRGGTLFDNGIDLSILLATHQSRSLTYNVNVVDLSHIVATAHSERVYSLGSSATYATDSFVWRGDLLLTLDDYLLGLNDSGHFVDRHWQSIIGGDWSGDSGLQLGSQLHFDSHNSSKKSQWWISFLIGQSFYNERLFLEQILFKGINNSDWWAKSTLKWIDGAYAISLIYNYLYGDLTDGGIGVFDQSDYLQLSFEWTF